MSRLVLRAPGAAPIVLRRRSTIGRSADADLAVDDPSVAETHAVFAPQGGRWAIVAREGTVLHNGSPAACALLRDGDVLCVGGVRLHVERAEDPVPPRVTVRRCAAALAVLLACGLFGVGLAEARPAAAPPSTLELQAGGPAVTWEGEAWFVEAVAALHDPAQSLIELHVDAPGRTQPFSLEINGEPSGEVAGVQVVSLRQHLVAGRNRILLRTPRAEPIRSISLRISVLPLPRCNVNTCLAAMRATMARAERLEREQRVAAPNLFEAFRLLRKARGLAVAAGDADARGEAERRLARVEAGLASRCADLRFAAARHLALGDALSARRTARELLSAFPSDEHPCRSSGEELLRLLDEGGW